MTQNIDITIYHNPRCSKSRQTLQLLRDRGAEPTVVEYLTETPDAKTLGAIIKMLGIEAMDLIRQSEPLYKELGLDKKQDDPAALVGAMVAHPTLIQRPIVVRGKRARLGRPPEDVLELL